MERHGYRVGLLALLLTGTLVVIGTTLGGAAPAAATAEGTIKSVEASRITIITGAGGQTQVRMTAKTRVISQRSARFEGIKVGDFIGVAAKKEADGSLTAVSINIFSPELKGLIRQGQSPMESGNVMTNAIVTQYVSRVTGRTLYLKYNAGTATIKVPSKAEVHRLVLRKAGDLRAGMRVLVRGTRNVDGSMTASSISINSSGR